MSHSIDRSSTPSAARLSLTLLLSCLLVFPDGAALAQTACNKTNWYTSTSANQNLPYNIETFAAVINVAQNGHPYLYAIGGNDYYPAGSDDYQTTVAYFELGSNGSVGNSTTQSLWNLDGQPVGLARDLCGVVYTNNAGTISYLYTVGGATEDMKTGTFNLTNQIWFAQIKANGSLGTWTKADVLMPSALQLHGTAILNGYLYVIGGTTTKGDTGLSAGLTSEVVIFQINDSNGNLETTYNGGQGYQTGPAIYSGASAGDGIYKTCPVVDAAKNTIYVAGGENKVGDPSVSTVMYATQDQNGTGTLSSWASANDLGTTSSGGGTATPLAAQAVVYNDYDNYNAIILMGGDTGSSGSGAQDKDTSNVLQGVIADWPAGINWSWSPTPLPSLPVGIPPGSGVIERNAGATYKNFIYSLGGEVTDNGSSDINAIYCLELN
jgi:hypothetical protein